MKNQESHKIVRKLRIGLGYTQEEVASWINTDRSNYTKKEKGSEKGVTLTADEFLTILRGFLTRGPAPKSKKDISENIEQLLKNKDDLAAALLKFCYEGKGHERYSNEDANKMLDRYEKLVENYTHMIDTLQERVKKLEDFIVSNSENVRADDPAGLNIKGFRKNP